MFLKVSCWPKLMSFVYTCVYHFESSSYSNQFCCNAGDYRKVTYIRTGSGFFHCQASAWSLCTCVPFQPT